MVKAKVNVKTPMAHLVEVAMEEESAIKSEMFKRNIPDKGQFGNQGIRNGPRKQNERREVRVVTAMCYLYNKTGHVLRINGTTVNNMETKGANWFTHRRKFSS